MIYDQAQNLHPGGTLNEGLSLSPPCSPDSGAALLCAGPTLGELPGSMVRQLMPQKALAPVCFHQRSGECDRGVLGMWDKRLQPQQSH